MWSSFWQQERKCLFSSRSLECVRCFARLRMNWSDCCMISAALDSIVLKRSSKILSKSSRESLCLAWIANSVSSLPKTRSTSAVSDFGVSSSWVVWFGLWSVVWLPQWCLWGVVPCRGCFWKLPLSFSWSWVVSDGPKRGCKVPEGWKIAEDVRKKIRCVWDGGILII
jgi:hypothetical protein